ncbi:MULTISPECIES: ATP-binding protein [unclassified Streptomyces]|nr:MULTISPECIES: ATP-binding protein [unclassified Streptomyces]ASY34175.1 ATP-binding protein [Streptomyces sp. CLI2509]MYR27726.1 ATP-binding protein [Streptomyces sp. SID4945]MYX22765.1 ATP-binding protein [Streptomyces sp. SID8380]SCF28314.1 Anti-sigma regulatory factor (Ser/Thr protein kinase) [Streptomyces sp. LcepLS]
MSENQGGTVRRTRLPRRRASVRKARDFAREVAGAWGYRELADALALVVSELVTNAVVHARCGAGRQVALTLVRGNGAVRVEVRDSGRGMPVPRAAVPFTEESGRGLAVVDAVAADWGVRDEVVGKTVWALLALEPDASNVSANGREVAARATPGA